MLGNGRRLGVSNERHGPARVMEQLAQDRVLLELGDELDELGQRGEVLQDDAGHVARQAAVAGVVLGELGCVVRKFALEEERVPTNALTLVERGPGPGQEKPELL